MKRETVYLKPTTPTEVIGEYGEAMFTSDAMALKMDTLDSCRVHLQKAEREKDKNGINNWKSVIKHIETESLEESEASVLNNLILEVPFGPRRFPVSSRSQSQSRPGDARNDVQKAIDVVLATWDDVLRQRALDLLERQKILTEQEQKDLHKILVKIYIDMRRKDYFQEPYKQGSRFKYIPPS